MLHTLDISKRLLERETSERDKDEVSYFNVGDVFCIHLGPKYLCQFLRKNLRGDICTYGEKY